MTLPYLLIRQARVQPERTAILLGTAPWASYGQWAARSAGLAERLRAGGMAPGDRVLLFMRNHPRYLELLWGAWWAGLVVVPVNAKLHTAEVEWIIDNAQARWAFVTHELLASPSQRLAGLERQVDAESDEAQRAAGISAQPFRRASGRERIRRRGVAVLYQRNHRPAQGRDDHAPQPDHDGANLLRGRRSHRNG